MANIDIKSSLLNDEDLKFVKSSLIKVSEKDGKDKFRVRVVEYINDSSYNNDDMFFYDMIEFIRFLNPGTNHIAFTTEDKEIYLNCPCNDVGENTRQWEFIYDHECLHQLWDTFGVAEKIKKEKGSYNHQVLNIASDCVINDYLDFYRKKQRPNIGVFPEKLKEKYGIEYDRKKDTQYSLYLKLMEVAEKLAKDPDFQDAMEKQPGDPQDGQSQGQSGQGKGQGQSGQGKGQGQGQSDDSNQSKSAEDAAEQAKQAQDAADKAKKAAEEAKKNDDDNANEKQKLAQQAQEAADKAKEAAEEAKKAKADGNKDAEEKAAQEAKEAADKAKEAADKACGNDKDDKSSEDKSDGDQSEDQNGEGDNKGEGDGKGHGSGTAELTETPEDIAKIKERAQEVIDKYKQKISGLFGEFIEKCKSSKDLKENGLAINTHAGSTGWNQKMNTYINTFVKKKVFQKKREYQDTYSRIRRGSGFVEYGKPIKPGKKIRENKLTISVAFYIDRSGSMSGCIDDVFKACYTISEALKKKFKKETVVDNIEFKVYAFDDYMKEIKYGNKCQAGGGTMSFDRILEFIDKNTDNYLINIIITDAEFSIDEKNTDDLLKKLKDGMFLFITNTENSTMKQIAKRHENQLFYILADSQFKLE